MAGPCPPRGAQRADPREEVGVSLGVLPRQQEARGKLGSQDQDELPRM